MKETSKLSRAAALLLAVSLSAGASGGRGREKAGGRRDKVSPDLRERVRGSRDERRRHRDGGAARVVVQLGGEPSGQLRGFFNRNGVLYGDASLMSQGVLYGDQILTSHGITISEGSPFLAAGVLYGDGVLSSDGALVADRLARGDCYTSLHTVLVNGERL